MGIVNINDDSFSGDGSLDQEVVMAQVRTQIEQGADCIDLGAESARTNREPITEAEEIERLRPVLECWDELVAQCRPRDAEQVYPPILSVNTWRPAVIQAVLEISPRIGLINDMSALAYPETLPLLADSSAALLVMHSVGLPKQDHSHQRWEDIVASVESFFTEKIALAEQAGIARERLVLDPGLDFAKTTADSLALIKAAERIEAFGCCVLWPLSRKNFIGDAIAEELPAQRDAGTVACLPFLGPSLLRVHNVDAAYLSTKVLSKIV